MSRTRERRTNGSAMTGCPPIVDYALLGDCRSAALVSRDGSLDWLCLPRYDSPSIFAALLDADHGGRFRMRPTGEFQASRRYAPVANIVETTFRRPSGAFILRDLADSRRSRPARQAPPRTLYRNEPAPIPVGASSGRERGRGSDWSPPEAARSSTRPMKAPRWVSRYKAGAECCPKGASTTPSGMDRQNRDR